MDSTSDKTVKVAPNGIKQVGKCCGVTPVGKVLAVVVVLVSDHTQLARITVLKGVIGSRVCYFFHSCICA